MKRQIIILVIVMGVVHPKCVLAQQDPLYNQYLFNQSMINPAYTGINDVFNATAISRLQWTGLEGAPITNTLNLSSSFLYNKVGAGLLLVQDSYGINSNLEVQMAYSYRIEWLGNILSFGVQGGYINYNYDFEKLNQEVQDPALLNANDQVSEMNFGTGVFFRTEHVYIGLSVPRILNTEVQDGDTESTRYRRHYYLSAGVLFDQLLAVKFKPSVLIKYVDKQPASIDLNAQILLKEVLWLGTTLRNFNALGLTSQLEVMDRLRFGYSFEIPLNSLSVNSFGSHELMVSFDLEIFNGHAAGRRYF